MKNQIRNSRKFLLLLAGMIAGLSAVAQAEDNVPRAHMVNVPVQKLNYDASNMMVTASGMLPNLCTAAPRPELRKTANPAVLQLLVEGEMIGDVCMDVAMVGNLAMGGNTFELAFDIRSLKFNLKDLNVNAEATYQIVGLDGRVLAVIDFGKVAFDLPFASHQIQNGTLALAQDGSVVAVGDETTVEVRSPLINLKKYIGHPVDMSGLVVSTHSSDFSVGRSPIERPLFLLTGLNTTTH